MRYAVILSVVAGLAGAAAQAEEVAVESSTLGASTVTLHLHGFLKKDELATLRLVASNEEALKLFVPGEAGRFAAIAVAPEEGFIRGGAPVGSASAVADLPDAATAASDALAACDGKRETPTPCVVVLEVAPAG